MSVRPSPALTAMILAVTLVACAATHPLPTIELTLCRGVGLDGVLRGDVKDPRLGWAEVTSNRSGIVRRRELVWPIGYTARFAPELEVLDASGRVAFAAGDVIDGGCVTGPGFNGPLYISPST